MDWIKIYEHDHFHREWEDYKNNLYMLLLNDDVEQWVEENLTGTYDINCDDYLIDSHCGMMIIDFSNNEDAMAFILRWL